MVSGEPLFGDDGATDDIPALQHLNVEAGASEVACGYQSVVPGADDDDLCVSGHRRFSVRFLVRMGAILERQRSQR